MKALRQAAGDQAIREPGYVKNAKIKVQNAKLRKSGRLAGLPQF
jgi:hypothetical protein